MANGTVGSSAFLEIARRFFEERYPGEGAPYDKKYSPMAFVRSTAYGLQSIS